MQLLLLVILNILCIMIVLHYKYSKFNVIKLGSIAVTLFWIFYSIFSGLFFLFDKFNFISVLVFQLLVMLSIVGRLFIKYGKKPILFDFSKDREGILLFLILIAFLLTGSKFELFSTLQDQGLYQAEALELYMGNYEVEHDFEEYRLLEKEEDREAYLTMIDEIWLGYNPLKLSEYTNDMEATSDVSGMYHGVQTFPAMLALMGRIFGMKNMVQVQTIFYVCSIVLLYYTMCDMKIRKGNRVFLTLVYMLSPLVLWVSKASYTEMFLSMLICFYLFLLFENDDKKWVISIPLTSFAFVHVSFLILWPIFWLINVFLYAYKKNKEYIYANILNALGMIVGYVMMSKISPQYFFMNCARLYIDDIVTKDNFVIWVTVIAVLSCIISWCILHVEMKYLENGLIKIQKSRSVVPVLLSLAVVFWIFHGLKTGYFMVPEDVSRPELHQYYGQGLIAFTHLAIYACAMATGFLILPAVIGSLFARTRIIASKTENFVLILLFLYIVIFQSVFFRAEIQFYYYYSRYLTYYIPIICLTSAVCFEKWTKKFLMPIVVVTFCSMLYFDSVIIQYKDDTIWEWETLEDLAMVIEEKSAVILNGEDVQSTLGPQLRTVAETSVFPSFEDLGEEIFYLGNVYENIYILSDKPLSMDDSYKNILNIVYRDQYQYSRGTTHVLGLYPTMMEQINREFILYQFEYEKYELGKEILFATENRTGEKYVTEGLSANEGIFSWTDGNSLSMQLWIPNLQTEKSLQACFDILHVFNGTQTVQVLVNDYEVHKSIISDGQNLVFEFEIPENGIVDMDIILPDAVSPLELGQSEDGRKLALALVKATFSATD